ncbi:hypothetical protein CEUSTIGMA_g1207.t1 [Chlamydomonas eustigma]|uniref:Uncharacterized protein n=1 Tax=Chlamydomonas eustigma TaxID=1157962 RepID=A0A250WSN2_9CHLO|nr:hypothetical protein CEUSTIGMA_g1207.t1 [Chlamydomonas eustigma]|eukprot:GAX73756.1 hypothetical protein CEUSTIGMA_g1207.t1 [Chlamydomonas eustigma]
MKACCGTDEPVEPAVQSAMSNNMVHQVVHRVVQREDSPLGVDCLQEESNCLLVAQVEMREEEEGRVESLEEENEEAGKAGGEVKGKGIVTEEVES